MDGVQITEDHCEQHHVHKFDNLDEIYHIPEDNIKTHWRWNEELNSPVSIKGTE